MTLDRKYFMLTLAMYLNGEIEFTEPHLVKAFNSFLSLRSFLGVSAIGTLTQSSSKWMGSYKGKAAEIGDLLLITKKGHEYKMSFLQAKRIPSTATNYNTNKKIRIDNNQHYMMTHLDRINFMHEKNPVIAKMPKFKSICNYLIFHKDDSASISYSIELASALSKIKPNENVVFKKNKSKKQTADQDNKKIDSRIVTINKIKYKDLNYADSLDKIMKHINDFAIGELIDCAIYNVLWPYLPNEITEVMDEHFQSHERLKETQKIENQPRSIFIDVDNLYNEDEINEILKSLENIINNIGRINDKEKYIPIYNYRNYLEELMRNNEHSITREDLDKINDFNEKLNEIENSDILHLVEKINIISEDISYMKDDKITKMISLLDKIKEILKL